ncbi:MAG: hypothetical protein Q8K93_35555, partial [Reyranella sp.]|nr:hypothetical protein [Reyranella sp.]
NGVGHHPAGTDPDGLLAATAATKKLQHGRDLSGLAIEWRGQRAASTDLKGQSGDSLWPWPMAA